MKQKVRFPRIRITLDLSGSDGNAFFVLGAVTRAITAANVAPQCIATYEREAKAGDYKHLLDTTRSYVTLIEL